MRAAAALQLALQRAKRVPADVLTVPADLRTPTPTRTSVELVIGAVHRCGLLLHTDPIANSGPLVTVSVRSILGHLDEVVRELLLDRLRRAERPGPNDAQLGADGRLPRSRARTSAQVALERSTIELERISWVVGSDSSCGAVIDHASRHLGLAIDVLRADGEGRASDDRP
jgi:hypothetical protein